MSAKFNRAFLATAALATLSASWGCVADRPSRNGVFNENNYVRKDFLVRSGSLQADGTPAADPGWMFKATILSGSTPNPLAGFGISAGTTSPLQIVRYDITNDKLRMMNTREIGAVVAAQATRDPEVVNAWSITNVDLKYQINLDGEKTNFYQENQELDWKVRQWVKLNFAKNDMSDLAPFQTQEVLAACTDQGNSTVTLVPDSFFVDEANDYMSWNVNMTFPLTFGNTACTEMYGEPGLAFQQLGRTTVNYTVKYSMTRAKALNADGTSADGYVPFELPEKDTIRRKYGTIDSTLISRDNATNLLAARQLVIRHDPNKPIIYYFAPGFPEERKKYFTDAGGIVEQTNQIFTDAGAAARLVIRNFDDEADLPKSADGQVHMREFGDVRYNWLRWLSDVDSGGQTGVLADTSLGGNDPRTGENVSGNIRFYNFNFTDFVQARLEFYLQSIGAMPTNADGSWPDGPANCKDGDVLPFVAASTDTTAATLASRNSHSTLYAKMQEYLQKPVAKWGNLSPADFVVKQDADFFAGYYAILPYQMYGDPAANQFVTPEGSGNTFGGTTSTMMARAQTEASFHSLLGGIDRGTAPFDSTPGPDGVKAAAAFIDTMRALTVNHREFGFAKAYNKRAQHLFSDSTDMFNYIDVFQRDGRRCINGAWETKEQYETNMADSYYAQTVWHEFGHTLGLDHNWMGSVDRPNFPHYKDGSGNDRIGGYAASLMDYNTTPDRVFWKNETAKFGWYPYDRAAIAFLYANAQKPGFTTPAACAPANVCTFSGQSKTGDTTFTRYADPYGVNADKTEHVYLYCNDVQIKYTPLCRQFDFGTTPSEIMASAIDNYEWQYKWRNFRLYRKYQNYSNYADGPASLITDMRRFISQWLYDWSGGELQDTLRRVGVTAPANIPAANYFAQLTDKFNRDISMANQLAGAFHKAVIQQSSGERPFKTVYDNFFGDVTQQGIFSDKLFALQSWVDLWEVDNYDPDQSAGSYLASYSSYEGDTSFENIAEDAVDSMVGGQYDTYPFLRQTAVTMFAKATHDLNFPGRVDTRDWIGGHVFARDRDFLDYFRQIAVQTNAYCPEPLTLDTCDYDPRLRRALPADVGHSDDFNEFVGPDNRRYAWTYIQDRNYWVVVDRDRNTASYQIVRSYNNQVIHGEDGSVGPFYVQLQVKYFLDSYLQYN